MSGYIEVPAGVTQCVVHTAGRFTSPDDVVHSWDLVLMRAPGSPPLDLHCDHCVSNVRGMFVPGREEPAFVLVEHDPACPWIWAEPPFGSGSS